jgi:hypothetical protein
MLGYKGSAQPLATAAAVVLKSQNALSRPRINERDQHDGQSERANYAKHDLVAVGPVHCWSPTGISGRRAARSRFKRAVLVLRMLRRPVIDAKLRPNAGPIRACGLPAAQSSSSRLSSSEVHGLLLFFGMARADVRMRLSPLIFRRARGSFVQAKVGGKLPSTTERFDLRLICTFQITGL